MLKTIEPEVFRYVVVLQHNPFSRVEVWTPLVAHLQGANLEIFQGLRL
jgi:hypothetical protein